MGSRLEGGRKGPKEGGMGEWMGGEVGGWMEGWRDENWRVERMHRWKE